MSMSEKQIKSLKSDICFTRQEIKDRLKETTDEHSTYYLNRLLGQLDLMIEMDLRRGGYLFVQSQLAGIQDKITSLNAFTEGYYF